MTGFGSASPPILEECRSIRQVLLSFAKINLLLPQLDIFVSFDLAFKFLLNCHGGTAELPTE